MLHRHIKALLDHGILIADVGTWADVHGCSWLMLVCIYTLAFESALTSVENHSVL